MRPFNASNVIKIADQICCDSPVEPRRLARDLPVEIQAMLGKLLAKEAANRYQNVGHVARDIDAVRQRADGHKKLTRQQLLLIEELAGDAEHQVTAGVWK